MSRRSRGTGRGSGCWGPPRWSDCDTKLRASNAKGTIMEDNGGEKLEHMKELVQRHEVCWEVAQIKSGTTDGESLHVGYEVLIAGIYNDPEHATATIREKTDLVLGALREVAADLTQHAGLPAEHRLKPYDEGVQTASKREHRAEARIKLGLLSQEGFHVAADEKLAASLRLLETRLKALGASKGSWQKH